MRELGLGVRRGLLLAGPAWGRQDAHEPVGDFTVISVDARAHLVAGNHDVHPMHPDAHKNLRAYLEVFASVQQSARRNLGGQTVLYSHFPYLDSTDPDDTHTRFEQWRLPDVGAWLLHGHIHSPRPRTGATSVHVGLDAWHITPVTLNVIVAMIS